MFKGSKRIESIIHVTYSLVLSFGNCWILSSYEFCPFKSLSESSHYSSLTSLIRFERLVFWVSDHVQWLKWMKQTSAQRITWSMEITRSSFAIVCKMASHVVRVCRAEHSWNCSPWTPWLINYLELTIECCMIWDNNFNFLGTIEQIWSVLLNGGSQGVCYWPRSEDWIRFRACLGRLLTTASQSGLQS